MNLGLATAQNANTGGDILAGVENAVGTNFNDVILGGALVNNHLTGRPGLRLSGGQHRRRHPDRRRRQ